MFVVVVEFEIKPEQRAAFLPLMLANARASAETEPGCRQFDVCADPQRPELILLYELYKDRAAFDAHCRTEHFLAFDAATRDMVVSKAVRFMERL
jgi:(4S)-4-hydroxy-5-phosphonooxypentane-2,3-dione isomerase